MTMIRYEHPCGCVVEVSQPTQRHDEKYSIVYCRGHMAVPELYEALKQLMDDSPCDPDLTDLWWEAWQRGQGIIGKVDEWRYGRQDLMETLRRL